MLVTEALCCLACTGLLHSRVLASRSAQHSVIRALTISATLTGPPRIGARLFEGRGLRLRSRKAAGQPDCKIHTLMPEGLALLVRFKDCFIFVSAAFAAVTRLRARGHLQLAGQPQNG